MKKQLTELRERLLNNEVLFKKEFTDIDLKTLIPYNTTVFITNFNVTELRPDCFCMEFSFKDFSGEEKKCTTYWESEKKVIQFTSENMITRA